MLKVWELLKLLPTFLGLFKKVMELWREHQNKKEREKQQKAIEEMEKAKTAEDVWKANEEITRNSP